MQLKAQPNIQLQGHRFECRLCYTELTYLRLMGCVFTPKEILKCFNSNVFCLISKLNSTTNYFFLQNSAFVAATPGVELESKWQGMIKGFFSGESLFLIRCSGEGDLWFNTYGGLIEIDVDGGYVVDTGNIVAFTQSLDYSISKVGGYKSLFFSGEGFVCRFKGKGKVWIQTRSTEAFTSWAHWFRPVRKNNKD